MATGQKLKNSCTGQIVTSGAFKLRDPRNTNIKKCCGEYIIYGSYTYCGSGCGNYGADIISLVSKYVSPHFIDFLNFKIDCIKNKTLSKTETERANSELEYYRRIINQIEKRPK